MSIRRKSEEQLRRDQQLEEELKQEAQERLNLQNEPEHDSMELSNSILNPSLKMDQVDTGFTQKNKYELVDELENRTEEVKALKVSKDALKTQNEQLKRDYDKMMAKI